MSMNSKPFPNVFSGRTCWVDRGVSERFERKIMVRWEYKLKKLRSVSKMTIDITWGIILLMDLKLEKISAYLAPKLKFLLPNPWYKGKATFSTYKIPLHLYRTLHFWHFLSSNMGKGISTKQCSAILVHQFNSILILSI